MGIKRLKWPANADTARAEPIGLRASHVRGRGFESRYLRHRKRLVSKAISRCFPYVVVGVEREGSSASL